MTHAARTRLAFAGLLLPLAIGCATSVGGGGGGDRLVGYRHPGELSQLPTPAGIQSVERGGPPADGELGPGGTVADRFTSEGEIATYRFRARAGELSIFELAILGFSRGWESTAGIRILDGAGKVLVERERAGGASHAAAIAFVAPEDGTYRFELSAKAQHYRYMLGRQVGLTPNDPRARQDAGPGDRLIGYLADERDRARMSFDVAAGEFAIVEVTPARANIRKGMNRRRGDALRIALQDEQYDAAPVVDAMLAAVRLEDAMNGTLPSDPLFHIHLGGDAETSAALHLVPAGDARSIAFDVAARGPSEGGIFEVHVTRDPGMHRLHGHVGDRDDDPLGGVIVYALIEPSLTVIGEATTGADGLFEMTLPEGSYTILAHAAPGSPFERAEVELDGRTELNLICAE